MTTECSKPLNDTAKVQMILELLLKRAKQCGLTDEKVEELNDELGYLLEDNSEGINTTLLEAIQIVLNR